MSDKVYTIKEIKEILMKMEEKVVWKNRRIEVEKDYLVMYLKRVIIYLLIGIPKEMEQVKVI